MPPLPNEAEAAAFEASIAAEEAARFQPAEPPQTALKEPPEPVKPDPEPTTPKTPPTPAEASPEPELEEIEAKALADAEDEEASVAERIKRSHIEAREAKKRAKLLEQELEVLRGSRTESRDETVQREAQQLAQRLSSEKLFNDECARIAATGQKEYRDFDATLGQLWEAVGGFNAQLVEAAIEAGSPEKVLHWLGRNPDEAERVAQLSPARQGAAIARIAAKVNAPKIRPVSNAPPPIAPVSGGSTGGESAPVDLDKMSMADAAKYWDAEDRKKRAARFG
jgi:hypothetical protein